MEKLVIENEYKIVVPLFVAAYVPLVGAAYAAPK